MTLDEFLSLIKKVRKVNGQWQGVCPAHNDSTPSLGIRDGGDRILVTCRANCSYESVLSALGLSKSDLFYEPLQDEEITYDYKDEKGTLLFQVVRSPGKRFKQRRPDGNGGWIYNLDGVRRPLYNLNSVVRAVESGETVFVVEGEKDVETLRSHGSVGTCNPMGAGKWLPEHTDSLRGCVVVCVADRDEPGEAHARYVAAELAGVAKSVRVCQSKTGKDATDHFAGGHGVEDFVPLRDNDRQGVLDGEGLSGLAVADLALTEASTQYRRNALGTPEPEYQPGRLYLLGGTTGGGKTSIAIQEYRAACERGERPLMVSMEMSNRDLKNRFLCHKGFDLKALERPWLQGEDWKRAVAFEAGSFHSWEGEIHFSTTAGASWCRDIIHDGDFDLLIFDHIHQVEKVAGGEEGSIAQEIREFRNIALDFDIPVLALSQFKRPLQPGLLPTLSDFKGSSAIEQNATMAMAIYNSDENYKLMILKNRDGKRDDYKLLFDGPRFTFTAWKPTPPLPPMQVPGVEEEDW